MNKIQFVDLKVQYKSIKEEMDKAIHEVLDNTDFIMGKNVDNFEKAFATFCNAKFCIGVSNGTTALELALRAAGIGPGDEVITVPNTFIATSEAITAVGASIKFIDVDPKTFSMEPTNIKISKKTKAILPVHLYGQPADMDPIIDIASKHKLIVIEDCAQAHGAEYKGKRVPVSTIGCFSFFPGKNLGAYGDAGAIVTNDSDIASKAAMLRNHGREKGEKYLSAIEGTNHRIDALQARILSVKLKYLDEWTLKRRKNALLYNKLLKGVITPYEAEYAKHVYHLYVIRTKKRDELKKYLESNGISCGIHYPVPLHLQPAYSRLGLGKGSFSVTEKAAEEILSLPMFPELSEEEISYIAEKVNEFK